MSAGPSSWAVRAVSPWTVTTLSRIRPRFFTEPLHPGDKRVYHATSHSGNFLECIRSRRQTICHPETAA